LVLNLAEIEEGRAKETQWEEKMGKHQGNIVAVPKKKTPRIQKITQQLRQYTGQMVKATVGMERKHIHKHHCCDG
jgi:hypothetical protein